MTLHPQPAPPRSAVTPGACLLHADFHPMTSECWGVTLDWYVAHDHLADTQARAQYQAAVERQMLDRHVRAPDRG
ncbi:hypothetical protein [Streptomyces sp. NPDC056069]|uniref:hypothetical protein n=1 Tax=Streptomyces sp. NPDC056069 TaxID=3345702 RepID=UPI0035DA0B41